MKPRRLRLLPLKAAWALFAVACLVGPAAAAPKTDRIVLRNGDHLTCEVRSLDRGRLYVKTDDIGNIYIEWDKVDSLRADATFQVEDLIGQQWFGRLREGPRGGMLSLETVSGIRNLDMRSVVAISRLGETLWNRLDGSIDLGTSYTSASELFTLDFAAAADFTRPRYKVGVDMNATLTRQTDVEDTRRWSASMDIQYRPPSRWLVFGQGLLEENAELGFSLRSSFAAGGGRYLVQSSHDDFMASVGLSVNQEVPLAGDATLNNEALVTLQYDRFSYDFPKVDILLSVTVFQGITQPDRLRAEADASIKRELIRDFNVTIRAYESYDSQPATEGAELNDYGLTFGFGWTF